MKNSNMRVEDVFNKRLKIMQEVVSRGLDSEIKENFKIEEILKNIGLSHHQCVDVMIAIENIVSARTSRREEELKVNYNDLKMYHKILMEEYKRGLISKHQYVMQKYNVTYEEADMMIPKRL